MLLNTTTVIEEAISSVLSVNTWGALVFIVIFVIFFSFNSLANIIPIYEKCSTNNNISSQICNKISIVVPNFGVVTV